MGSGPHRGLVEGVSVRTPLPDGLQTTPDNVQGLDLQTLRSEEGRLRQMIEAIPQGVWSLDLHGFTLSSNRALERLLGYETGGILGRHSLDLVGREGRAQAAQALTRCRQGQ